MAAWIVWSALEHSRSGKEVETKAKQGGFNMSFRDFLGGPVVTTLDFTVGSVSSIPGQGT